MMPRFICFFLLFSLLLLESTPHANAQQQLLTRNRQDQFNQLVTFLSNIANVILGIDKAEKLVASPSTTATSTVLKGLAPAELSNDPLPSSNLPPTSTPEFVDVNADEKNDIRGFPPNFAESITDATSLTSDSSEGANEVSEGNEVESTSPDNKETGQDENDADGQESESSNSVENDESDELEVDMPPPLRVLGVPYNLYSYEAPSGNTEQVVLLLHGMGGKAADMVPVMTKIQAWGFPKTKFVIPEAEKSMENNWFNVLSTDIDGPHDRDSILRAAYFLQKIGNDLESNGISRSKIVLIGESQGASLALTSYMRHKWGGVVAIAGYLPMIEAYPTEMTDLSSDAPGVVLAGSLDKVVPVGAMRRTGDKLKNVGRDVSYMEYIGAGHDIVEDQRSIENAVGLLNRVLAIEG